MIKKKNVCRSLGQVMTNISPFAKAKAGAFKLFIMIDYKCIMNIETTMFKEISPMQGCIDFRNVDFVYPSRPDVLVLRNFSFTIPANKTMAIVGPSGSGKSSIISLIERFYGPSRGEHTTRSFRVNLIILLTYIVPFLDQSFVVI